MSNGPRKIKWSHFTEDRNREAAVEIDLEDGGAPFTIPPPEFWISEFAAAKGDPDKAGVAVLGDAEWKRWKKAGKTFDLLNAVYEYAQGVSTGE